MACAAAAGKDVLHLDDAQFMWQLDTRAIAQFIKECMHAHGDPTTQSQASNYPSSRWLKMMWILSLS